MDRFEAGNFRFGFEYEFAHPDRHSIADLIQCETGIDVYVQSGWGKSDGSRWEMKYDSSCCLGKVGGELASPVLSGTEGLLAMEGVINTLASHVAVDERCGFHVHFVRNGWNCERVMRNWMFFEECLMDATPNHRQHSSAFSTFASAGIPLDSTDVVDRALHVSMKSRRLSLNVSYLKSRGTLEARIFHPPKSGREARMWISIISRMTDDDTPHSPGSGTLMDLLDTMGWTSTGKMDEDGMLFLSLVCDYGAPPSSLVAKKLLDKTGT